MPRVDMSAKAVTARLRLVSDLRDLCLLLGKAQIEQKPNRNQGRSSKRKSTRKKKSK
jgi:hypothetical protein